MLDSVTAGLAISYGNIPTGVLVRACNDTCMYGFPSKWPLFNAGKCTSTLAQTKCMQDAFHTK